MPWKRLGLIYKPRGGSPWAQSHASLPFPIKIGEDLFRIFFSVRDEDNRSSISWVDVDLSVAPRVINEAQAPALASGSDGTFDDSGVGLGSIVQYAGQYRLYYMGWNLGVRAPWRNSIGLAIAETSLDQFERYSPGPIMDRSPEDPYTMSYPWVMELSPGDWRMWYGSNLSWGSSSADMSHVVKMARSSDGIRWERDGATVVGFDSQEEYAIARPTVVRVGSSLLMCFACRGDRYRIGAAISQDGIHWRRMDDVLGLGVSDEGWDSEMTCYPSLFWFKGKLWMLYNGNGYGSTGFGLAVWEGEFPFT